MMTDKYFHGKTALVTGASSGIGEELAWQLGGAKEGGRARRGEEKERQGGV
jgi:NAD(P)-dependent dehydrogenase (short-subunit alcohol dehydrogenase family)